MRKYNRFFGMYLQTCSRMRSQIVGIPGITTKWQVGAIVEFIQYYCHGGNGTTFTSTATNGRFVRTSGIQTKYGNVLQQILAPLAHVGRASGFRYPRMNRYGLISEGDIMDLSEQEFVSIISNKRIATVKLERSIMSGLETNRAQLKATPLTSQIISILLYDWDCCSKLDFIQLNLAKPKTAISIAWLLCSHAAGTREIVSKRGYNFHNLRQHGSRITLLLNEVSKMKHYQSRIIKLNDWRSTEEDFIKRFDHFKFKQNAKMAEISAGGVAMTVKAWLCSSFPGIYGETSVKQPRKTLFPSIKENPLKIHILSTDTGSTKWRSNDYKLKQNEAIVPIDLSILFKEIHRRLRKYQSVCLCDPGPWNEAVRKITAYSLRSGMAIDRNQANETHKSIMHAGGWTSLKSMLLYIRPPRIWVE